MVLVACVSAKYGYLYCMPNMQWKQNNMAKSWNPYDSIRNVKCWP